mmetsp:Transcript_37179/g.48921  ORF Transcript_37179/g.48921 Transcript_37179/m.48921 type:complete len:139 (+) Transcript_37179:1217-1633(+)
MMKEDGSLQFRYWVATRRHEYDRMLGFFNIISHSKRVKRANSLAIDAVKTKQILFVPMLAKRLTLEEACAYENLSDCAFEEIRANPEQLDLDSRTESSLAFHTDKCAYDEKNQVKVRLMCADKLPINFETRWVSKQGA